MKKNISSKNNKNIPLFSCLGHCSELDINSKKQINPILIEENYKETNFFDVRNQNINGIDISNPKEEDDQFLNNSKNKSYNMKEVVVAKDSPNIVGEISNQQNDPQQKTILAKQKGKKKGQKIKNKKKRNDNKKKRSNSSLSMMSLLSSKSNIEESKVNKDSQMSSESGNSTKKSKNILKTRYSPEKYPEDYMTVEETDDEEEDKIELKENQKNNNNCSLIKSILEEGKILNKNVDQKKNIEQQLEGFDLMAIDMKSVYRDKELKKKYFKNFKANIMIVFFDKDVIPLHAIFVIKFDKNFENNTNQYEKILFPGAFEKEEFIEICNDLFRAKKIVKAELIMDYSDPPFQEFSLLRQNKYLINDFYFLINIIE